MVQFSHPYMTTGKIIALTRWTFVGKVMSLLFNMLSRLAQTVQCLSTGRRPGFDPWVGKVPWRRKCQSTPGLLPGKSHGQRSLEAYSPWGRKESDTTERLHFLSFFLSRLVIAFLLRSKCFLIYGVTICSDHLQ